MHNSIYSLSSSIAMLLHDAVNCLKHSSPTANLDAELLLMYCLNTSRAQLLTGSDSLVNPAQQLLFTQLLQRRLSGEPMAYICGKQEFWSLPLAVTTDTLIPRTETELLVELVLTQIAPFIDTQTSPWLADLGTGSGAIALAIASERPDWRLLAIDNSNKALQIAQQNATRLRFSNVQFCLANWCSVLSANKFAAIISNPPYIAEKDPHLAGNIRFEPNQALVSGSTGLLAIAEIIPAAWHCLQSGGWLLIEHGANQQAQVIQLFTDADYHSVQGFNDYAGQQRVVIGRK